MRPLSRFAYGLATLGLGLVTACGGDSTGPKTAQISQQEAQTIAADIFSEVSRAIATASPALNNVGPGPSLATTGGTVHSTFSANCTSGGGIAGSSDYTSGLDTAGTGPVSISAAITIDHCAVSTGTRTIAVSGNLNFASSVSFLKYEQSSNFAYTMNGNYAWDGGSCALNYNITVTPQQQMSFKGNICGVSIDYSSI